MTVADTRRHIAQAAARLVYDGTEEEFLPASRKAARRLGIRLADADLPGNAEVRDQLRVLQRLHGGTAPPAPAGNGRPPRIDLADLRLEALRMMRRLARFHPRAVGLVTASSATDPSASAVAGPPVVELLLFARRTEDVLATLEHFGCEHVLARDGFAREDDDSRDGQVTRPDEGGDDDSAPHRPRLVAAPPPRIHVDGPTRVVLTVLPPSARNTGAPLPGGPGLEMPELELLLVTEAADRLADDADRGPAAPPEVDRWALYRMLLAPLESVRQDALLHPEGDALYHSLQVFELMRAERPWDEELLTAALLHDVGLGLDPSDAASAAVAALEGAVSERTAFFIGRHPDAHALKEGKLGFRAARALRDHEDYEALLLLRDCDERGRRPGMPVGSIDDALEVLRSLAAESEGDE